MEIEKKMKEEGLEAPDGGEGEAAPALDERATTSLQEYPKRGAS